MRSSKDGNITGEARYGGIFTLKDGEGLNHTDSSRFQRGGSRKVRAASRRLTGPGTARGPLYANAQSGYASWVLLMPWVQLH